MHMIQSGIESNQRYYSSHGDRIGIEESFHLWIELVETPSHVGARFTTTIHHLVQESCEEPISIQAALPHVSSHDGIEVLTNDSIPFQPLLPLRPRRTPLDDLIVCIEGRRIWRGMREAFQWNYTAFELFLQNAYD